jgi:hypothetical protein
MQAIREKLFIMQFLDSFASEEELAPELLFSFFNNNCSSHL